MTAVHHPVARRFHAASDGAVANAAGQLAPGLAVTLALARSVVHLAGIAPANGPGGRRRCRSTPRVRPAPV